MAGAAGRGKLHRLAGISERWKSGVHRERRLGLRFHPAHCFVSVRDRLHPLARQPASLRTPADFGGPWLAPSSHSPTVVGKQSRAAWPPKKNTHGGLHAPSTTLPLPKTQVCEGTSSERTQGWARDTHAWGRTLTTPFFFLPPAASTPPPSPCPPYPTLAAGGAACLFFFF